MHQSTLTRNKPKMIPSRHKARGSCITRRSSSVHTISQRFKSGHRRSTISPKGFAPQPQQRQQQYQQQQQQYEQTYAPHQHYVPPPPGQYSQDTFGQQVVSQMQNHPLPFLRPMNFSGPPVPMMNQFQFQFQPMPPIGEALQRDKEMILNSVHNIATHAEELKDSSTQFMSKWKEFYDLREREEQRQKYLNTPRKFITGDKEPAQEPITLTPTPSPSDPSSNPNQNAKDDNPANAAAPRRKFSTRVVNSTANNPLVAKSSSSQRRSFSSSSSSSHHYKTSSQAAADRRRPQSPVFTSTKRQIGMFSGPQSENLDYGHFNRYTEIVPFRLHFKDAMRAVTKWTYMRTNFNKGIKVEQVRPVFFPYWGFQGSLKLTHIPSNTTKTIDYNDVTQNNDAALYCALFGVHEDELYHNSTPHQLVNPNYTLGRAFEPKDKDHGSTSPEQRRNAYIRQPNSINTLRMRAQQVFSGTEWVPWMTEPLKMHLDTAQEFAPELLNLPNAPIYPPLARDPSVPGPELSSNAYQLPEESNLDGSLDLRLEDSVSHAQTLRADINPLTQTYDQSCALDRAWKQHGKYWPAMPQPQDPKPLQTDGALRSEFSGLVSSLSHMLTLELNLINRGVGVVAKPHWLSQHGEPNPNNIPTVLTSLPAGAFISIEEQRLIYERMALNSGIDQEKITLAQQNHDHIPLTKGLEALRHRLTDPELPHKQGQRHSSSNKNQSGENSPHHSHPTYRSHLKKHIRNALLDKFATSNASGMPTGGAVSTSFTFAIPGTDYSATFSGVKSRRVMYPGYVSRFNYMERDWRIITGAITGISAGIPHRHWGTILQSTVIGAATARFALQRLIIPPMFQAVALLAMLAYSARDITNGHFQYARNAYRFQESRQLEKKFDAQLYSSIALSSDEVHVEDVEPNDFSHHWSLIPPPSFYQAHSESSRSFWENVALGDNVRRDKERSSEAQNQQAAQKRQEEQKRQQSLKHPSPIPSDPYILLFGAEYFGLKTPQNEDDAVTLKPRLSQVLILNEHDVKQAARKQLLVYHPDMYRPESAWWPPEYGQERTMKILSASNKIKLAQKKTKYDQSHYS